MLTKLFSKPLTVAIVAALPLSALGQTSFTELNVFGDSLLDSGNFGIRFTNQLTDGSGEYARISPQYLAEYLGVPLEPAVFGGSNYAVGGYRSNQILNSISGTGIATGVGTARPAYLTENTGDIQPGSLFLIDGGGNDLRDILTMNPPAAVPGLIQQAAQALVGAVGALHSAGADYLMVANVPDLGVTPGVQLAEIFSPGAAAGFSSASAGFNSAVSIFVTRDLGDANIIPVDINGFVTYVLDNAASYGLANGDLDVSSGFGLPAGSAVVDQRSMCYQATFSAGVPDCIEHPLFGINGPAADPRQLFFNDSLHPTEIASEIFGDYLIDILAAPTKVGMLPQLGFHAARSQILASGDELRRSRWTQLQGRLFVAGAVAMDEYEQAPGLEVESKSLTLGKTFKVSEHLLYGIALTRGQEELEVTGVEFESDSWGLLGLLGYRRDQLFIDAMAALSALNYDDIKRDVRLGSETLVARGDTEGHAWSLDLLVGYDLLSSEAWHLAPALGLQYMKSVVDSYSESGGAISNYNWGEQNRKSVQWRYGLVASGEVSSSLRLFAEVFGASEQEDDIHQLDISNSNFSTRTYRLPGFGVDDDNFVSAAAGGSLSVGNDASINLTYNYSDRGDGFQHLVLSFSMPL